MLAKKGPLGKIWLAAHMGEKKVPKVQVVATNIPESIQHIENPSARPRPGARLCLNKNRAYAGFSLLKITHARWPKTETVQAKFVGGKKKKTYLDKLSSEFDVYYK